MNNIPQHNYMTYKRQSTLGYFSEIKPKQYNKKSVNSIYNTMKSYSMINKMFNLFNQPAKKQKKQKKPIKINTFIIPGQQKQKNHSENQSYNNSLTQQISHQSLNKNRMFQTTFKEIKKINQPKCFSQATSVSSSQPSNKHHRSYTQAINPEQRKKSKSIHQHQSRQVFYKTFTQLKQIKSKATSFQFSLKGNKNQINLINKYKTILDQYYDKIPSPTNSVTRQSMIQNQKLIKFCQQDIYLDLKINQKKKKYQQIEHYNQPLLPQNVTNNLMKQMKQEWMSKQKIQKQKKNNKIRIKQRFLSQWAKRSCDQLKNEIISKKDAMQRVEMRRKAQSEYSSQTN